MNRTDHETDASEFEDYIFDGGILEVSALAESREKFVQIFTAAQLSDTSGSEKGATGLLRLWEKLPASLCWQP